MPENGNVAVLSDIHGNLAYPQKTMAMLYELAEKYKCYFIKGNKEGYWLHYRKCGEKGWPDRNSTTGTLLYTYRNLTDKDLQFFSSLTHVQTLKAEGVPALTLCHGSPEKVNSKMLLDDMSTLEVMKKDINTYILCGHTHIQQKIMHEGKIVLNPGSVGMPLESGGKAQFMILHAKDGEWQEEFISLKYDSSEIIADLKEAGLDKAAPFWYKITIHSLKTGRKSQSHGSVLDRAMALCEQKYGQCVWPNIPDECWKQAYTEIINEEVDL